MQMQTQYLDNPQQPDKQAQTCTGEMTFFCDISEASCGWATAAGAGDITDVFSCSTGDCTSVTVQTGETLKIDDDVQMAFGNGTDWTLQYDESVDDQLLFETAKTSAIATTDPMFEILTDTGAAGMTANQQVFGVAVGSQASNTPKMTLDEDGDVDFAGTITAGSGNIAITNTTGNLDGEQIANDTIDDDSIDFVDVTGADLTLTDAEPSPQVVPSQLLLALIAQELLIVTMDPQISLIIPLLPMEQVLLRLSYQQDLLILLKS